MILPTTTVVEYIHDPLGRRIAKKVNGGIVEKYLCQGMTRLLAVYDGSNNLIMRFLYADTRMPVAMTVGGETYYLGYDQVGSLRVVTDSLGNVVKRIDYDSFGNIISDTNPTVVIPFGFAGGLHDRDTGLVRFGYRDYDPQVGRWTAKDPIGPKGQDMYFYAYTRGNPVSLVDPLGLEIWVAVRKSNAWWAGPLDANHLFLSDTTTQSGYGMAASSGSDVEHAPENEPPPGTYVPVPGSEGREGTIMDYMREIADTGVWFPGWNDCFTKVQDTLTHFDLSVDIPFNRAGPFITEPTAAGDDVPCLP